MTTTSQCKEPRTWLESILSQQLVSVDAEGPSSTPPASVKPVGLVHAPGAASVLIPQGAGLPWVVLPAHRARGDQCAEPLKALEACSARNRELEAKIVDIQGFSIESIAFGVILSGLLIIVGAYASRERRLREQIEMTRAFEKHEMRRQEVWNRKGQV